MTPEQFVAKWSPVQQKETAVAQSHFNDLCALVGHAPPLEFDPAGTTFSFETQTVKPGGQKGFADVYYRDKFIWEYKGPHKDLEKAYRQLQLYREDLQNPPLLITSDIHTIIIHTNFNNYPTVRHTITFEDIKDGEGVEKLRWVFFDPQAFTPARTQEQITKATANTFLRVANQMKQHRELTGEEYTPEQLAHFLVRLLFCLFAEDMRLLPDDVFTKTVRIRGGSTSDLQPVFRNLFAAMRGGGYFGMWPIRHFDGTLFDDDFVPSIPYDLGRALFQAAEQDWSQVDPSIFGTLFERVIDEGKRAQLGAHYTSETDIMLIVEPVLMEPLKRRWDEVRLGVDRLLRGGPPAGDGGPGTGDGAAQAHRLLADFAAEVAGTRVLDPACGSGNFLYVALRELLDLQKKVIAYAARRDLPPIALSASPEQLYGIEINPYAHELAQVTVWIGYLQWRQENGFGEMADPILRPLHNIRHMDAILAYDEDGRPTEPEWPPAEVIIGNPPFLGSYKLRSELGEKYVDDLFDLYVNHVPGAADLVCYWFNKSRKSIVNEQTQRVGLISTNSIRGGANRTVLDKIKIDGDIFMAWSDKPWILDGAAVRVSIIGFDNGSQKAKALDGKNVDTINADLTKSIDLTKAKKLSENTNIAFSGTKKGGPFDISEQQAQEFLQMKNKTENRDNKEVIHPWINGREIIGRPQNIWIIDFGAYTTEEAASLYEGPYQYVKEHVFPIRRKNRRKVRRERWWLHSEAAPALRKHISNLDRFIVTARVSKHRIYIWASVNSIPDDGVYAFAREDDYFFGVLNSRMNDMWAVLQGTSLGPTPRYTASTSFETYPFPWPPGTEPAEHEDERVAEIAHWARELVAWRQAWLHPPPPQAGAIDVAYDKMLKKRTLTNLYNGLVYVRETVKAGQLFDRTTFDKVTRKSAGRAEIQELDDIHTALDRAVLDAYGWPHHLTDEEILERLLALNLERAGS